MRKQMAMLLAVLLCFGLGACARKSEVAQNQQDIPQAASQKEIENTEKASDADEEPIQWNPDLIGPWHLDERKNDLAAFENSLDLFPGYGEWGASMEIRGNGEMSWYIGVEGWHGTYSVEKNVLHGVLTSDLEQITKNWDMLISWEDGTA